ncbi:MAG TPA: RHS repeat protein, partial [Gammaproteobacteria bacterium]|nr:RHS repeat protein [Gammaproteobacteria bacterium]
MAHKLPHRDDIRIMIAGSTPKTRLRRRDFSGTSTRWIVALCTVFLATLLALSEASAEIAPLYYRAPNCTGEIYAATAGDVAAQAVAMGNAVATPCDVSGPRCTNPFTLAGFTETSYTITSLCTGTNFTHPITRRCPPGYVLLGELCQAGNTPVPEKNQGKSQCPDGLSNPITAGVGNKFQAETDLPANGPWPGLTRYYNSLGQAPGSRFGVDWRDTFDRTVQANLAANPPTAIVRRETGKGFYFTRKNGQWLSDKDVVDRLEELTNSQGTVTGWRLKRQDNRSEDYALNGTLLSITETDGRVVTLSYDSLGRLNRVDATTGEYIVFTYDNQNRVTTITDQASRLWTYRYDDMGYLRYVDNPDGTTRQYHYNESGLTAATGFMRALTGITDERGIRYATYGYDAQGRASLSTHAGNAQRVDISYNDTDGTRVVTNSLGQPSTYTTDVQ